MSSRIKRWLPGNSEVIMIFPFKTTDDVIYLKALLFCLYVFCFIKNEDNKCILYHLLQDNLNNIDIFSGINTLILY